MGMFGGSFMMVGIMLFWVVLIAIGFYLLYRFINGRKEELSPMEILKVRLAKGEISLEEFERLSKKCE
ncbi:SHOCT domain-containing protein [Anoxybacillus flavithermus]|uniref:SHOCT domain-containing protein n=1 Tax=Anoxybacillus flavithermus TaxID=33934 RepID=UPI001868DAF0|nr:SHOCT domain-containing protein [Anoxybacillus flavithermus]MBE2941149.1 SHOCT domain-containing protein [Anoxybacillus flavithermus]MBE2944123.1 SHOCT domain-containing protein [Anoxybacillus flavithermus]MBE2952097.1 SHOCT domain-containing protein [Anoxybacillus flavithermus]MBE2954698.1 SHOCT domain-containing protein [Anoxybacillus flavithermus]MBE2960329.1 SHOCT domain-containing protein [Anoxybacillus flavithermus]